MFWAGFFFQTVYLAALHAFVVGYAFRISIAHGSRDARWLAYREMATLIALITEIHVEKSFITWRHFRTCMHNIIHIVLQRESYCFEYFDHVMYLTISPTCISAISTLYLLFLTVGEQHLSPSWVKVALEYLTLPQPGAVSMSVIALG